MQLPLQVTKNNPASIFNAGSNPSNIINVGGTTFFTATDSNNVTGLWRVNGSLPPVFVSNIRLGSQPGLNDLAPVIVNGSLVFANSDINNNIEIWKIDSGFGSTTTLANPIRFSLPLFTGTPRFSNLTNSNGNLYFVANENTSISSLWGLDFNGNPLRMGSLPTNLRNPGNIINVNGTVFFTATNSLNTSPTSPNPATELFILGTGNKIISVKNTLSSIDNPINPTNFVTANGKLYFTANDTGNRFGRELWTLDSRFTPVRVSDIAISSPSNPSGSSNPAELTAFGGTLYFTAEQQPGNRQLWKVDANGVPSLVKEISSTSLGNYRNLTIANGNLYFSKDISSGSELWRLDGNGSAIRILSPLFTNISHLTNINGALYFSARDSKGSELWTLDSFGNPKLTSEINLGAGSSNPSNLTAVDNILYFSADDGKTGQELWQIDTRSGVPTPKILADINEKNRQIPANLVNVNDTLYYSFNDISGVQLWRLDKATGQQVKISSPSGWNSISNVTTVNNNLYFTTNDASGQKLWKLDSVNGNVLTTISNLGTTGTTYEQLLSINGNLFIVVTQPDRVKKLWRIDSNGISTNISLPTTGANNNISNLINYNGLLHFTTTRSDGLNELFRINSTGTSELISIPPTSTPLGVISIRNLTVVGNKLNFVTENSDARRFLWSTDQNRITSQITLPFSMGGSLNLSQIVGVGNSLHFIAQNGTFPPELWRLDDFGKPLRIMTAPNPSQPAFENLTNINGTLYFTNNFGKEIWKSDQQSPPIRLLSPNSSDPNFRISNLTNINGNLYVNIADSISGQELWKIEANNSFTQMSDINPGVKSSNPANSTYANGKLYFVADNGIDSDEIWSLDVGFPNVAPTLADTNISFTINEDATSPFGSVGFLVSSIARLGVGGNITDANGPNTGIAIVGGDTSGTLFYSTDNGLRWNFVDTRTLSNSKALLLSADANNRLYFRPAANFNGTVGSAIAFRAWDGSTGVNGAFANAGSNGGFTAFSSATDVVSMTVTSINDVPLLSKGYSFSIPDVYENGTVLGKIAALDTDGDALNWSITSGNKDTNGDGTFAFSINANTGEIQISDRTDLNPQLTPSFQLQLSVNDGTVTVRETVNIKLVRSPGDLDPNFGNGGKVVSNILGRAWDVEQLADGKILTLGYGIDTTTGLSRFAFTRHNANGSLDNSFGNSGNVVTAISPLSTSQATKMQVQSDGKIIATGSRSGVTGSDFVVAKFNSDGTGDSSFGVNGIVSTDMGTAYDYSRAIAIQADGKVVITGIVWNSTSSYDFAVARYNTDGSLDTSFGNGGKVTTPVGTGTDYAEAIAIQVDGKIIVSGMASDSQGSNFASVRYNSDGSLDTTFGNQGKVRTLINSSSYAYATAIQDDGKIVVAGNSSSQFALARYNSDGSLDTAFGNQGKVSTFIADSTATARKIEIQTDGKILVVGDAYNSSSSSYEFAIARYNVDGSLDSSFGNGGRIFTPIGERTQDYGYSATIQADGKILVAGDSGGNLALVRYESELQTPLQSQSMSNLPAFASPSPQEIIPNTGGWKLDSLVLTSQLSPMYTEKYPTVISTGESSMRSLT
ncbi:hypothetical protein [Calothrix sp. PCC 6303]|uniref:hypothetical protein n=1 Tax=Calothrix sp. PCC 6303 TaxID=1170562 RepID=UPI0002A003B5|nr:hypothetical protein [Calothrix sp. PCC 6303]AFZ04090.1 Delta-60 repeat-containing protein [Calothrix sp. PCC 6303]